MTTFIVEPSGGNLRPNVYLEVLAHVDRALTDLNRARCAVGDADGVCKAHGLHRTTGYIRPFYATIDEQIEALEAVADLLEQLSEEWPDWHQPVRETGFSV